jgi:hypothetical protein
MLWGYLLHLSYNMWCDREAPEWASSGHGVYRPYLRCDDGTWRDLVRRLAEAGVNLVVVDVGDGVRFASHPEIAVEGAWTPRRLRDELQRMRDLGIRPAPKLNFSTAHDVWLGEVSRCVSTPAYYRVCRDLIAEAIDLFGGPDLFHLGMDEETAAHQRHYAYAVMRQHELWWHDLRLLVDAVEAGGSRAWVWSDYAWAHPDEFYVNMPKSVVQSNWYYGASFDVTEPRSAATPLEGGQAHLAYLDLATAGYDQIPTGSNWSDPANFEATVRFCAEHVPPASLLGFLQTPWHPTLPEAMAKHAAAIEQVAAARKWWEAQ